jgi:tetratricopeptide (TPR) repeat protein
MKTIKLLVVIALIAAASLGSQTQPASGAQPDRISALEERLAKEPGDRETINSLAWLYFLRARQNDAEALNKAIALYERGFKLYPDEEQIQVGLGLVYFMRVAALARSGAEPNQVQEELKRTLATFQMLVPRTPEGSLARAAYGAALTISGALANDFKLIGQGVTRLNNAVAAAPQATHSRLFRAFTFINFPPPVRDSKRVAEDLTALIKDYADEHQQGVLRLMLGDMHFENGDLELARAEYEAAAKLQAAAAGARGRLAMLKQGRPEMKVLRDYRANTLNCAACHRQ